ncbi:DUF6443 domain-containing protein [Dyadobacter chenhuakuii]|uniref:DUF6443 domain-containing protein n=1 Tax=Dyadobacter chenhuakuii TaxID=2909339 RepID=A0A9X1QFF7_9BACT|nr:DUF6443 domain-containing protein [Dyadobacter chenhuakuii]MCF2500431.1 DUF6443 domain-containing protein [Dyadobacter chenhuakuii]
MNHYLKYMLLAFLLSGPVKAQQTNSRNYVISRIYKQSGADINDVSKVATEVQYLDGLGRPLQNILVGQSPLGKDLVYTNEFDAAGRQPRQYLPYVSVGNGAYQSNAPADAAAWYNANSAGLQAADLARPYQETLYETSPASRITNQRAPGNKSVSSVVRLKTNATNQINRYDYDPVANTIVQVGQYAAGALTYINNTDEQGNVTNEFTDLLGQTICRQVIAAAGNTLSTYYVYDDLKLLRAVLQPGFQDVASLTDYAFTYDYDERGRMVVRKVPGSGMTEFAYDQYDRLVMSRDANQKIRNVWAFIKYDAQNRPILIGEIASALARTDWSVVVDANTQHHEDRNNGINAGYTLDKTAPKNATEANLLNITFYDDYAFSKAANLSYNAAYYPSANLSVKSQVTGSRTRMLPGSGAAGGWLTTVTYYDAEYRPIQATRELSDLGAGGIERVSSQYKYDLAPIISEQKTEQLLAGNVTHSHLATYSYDHSDRLLSVKEKIISGANTKEAYTLAQRYNTLGQLQSKWLHSEDGTKFRLRTNYTHNIRGWLTEGKTAYKKDVNGPDLPYYGFNLAYNNGANYTNGNISQMQWLGKDEANFSKGLTFSYDGANRLLGSSGLNAYPDTEKSITYDKNGNIKTLVRAGAAVDNLTYTYLGNRLSSVTDGSGNNLGVKNGASNYAYDDNGNITGDGNRGATLIYNYLNLPKTIKIAAKTFTYDYDANGSKHKYAGDTLILKYAGNFEYRQVAAVNKLYRVALSEGQAVFRDNKLAFEYSLKDHLGNVRVVFDEEGQVLQKTDYYAFGLSIDRNNPVQTPAVRNGVNRYLYNNKELQVGSGYLDYGARMYMPEIGRWGVVDPMSEIYEGGSPYNYVFDNPINWTDPDGRCPTCPQGDEAKKTYAEGAIVTNQYGSWTWTGSDWQTNSATSVPSGSQAMAPVSGFTGWADQIWNGNRTYGDGRQVSSDGILLNRMTPRMGTPPDGGFGKVVSIKSFKDAISKVIHWGKQGKHILGHNNLKPGASILQENAQDLLDAFHEGRVVTSQVVNETKTRVDFGKVIGSFVKDGVSLPTTKGMIINSKTGVHIVPAAPN